MQPRSIPYRRMSAPAARLAEGASGPNLLVRWWRNRQLARSADKRLNLALQGGGAHGAFTWGVLDGLIEDPRVTLEGISGSSAGAINAVVMAHGWMQGGRDGARKALADFWRDVGQQIPWGLMTKGEGESLRLLPATRMLAQWVSLFSPGNLNPLSINPLRTLLKNQVDFDALRKHTPFKLFVGATQANTGRLRLFREHELTLDMLLASACLPKVHPTVEIEGEPYWDGGYAANPAVFPLIYDCESSDIMVVLLAPHHHHETPHTMEDIDARIQDFGFKTHFLREMQMIARVNAMANDANGPVGSVERKLTRRHFHMIDSDLKVLQRSDTKMLAHGPFLDMLHDEGLACARAWLSQHGDRLGQASTVDLRQWLT